MKDDLANLELAARAAQTLAKAGATDEARLLYRKARDGQQVQKAPTGSYSLLFNYKRRQDELSLNAGIAAAQTGDIQEAREIAFVSLTDRDSNSSSKNLQRDPLLAAIVEAQCRAGDLKAAKKTVEDINRGIPRWITLMILASAQAKAGDFVGAKQSASAIDVSVDWSAPQAQAEALATIALEQARHNNLSGAKQTLAAAKGKMSSPNFIFNLGGFVGQTVFPDPCASIILVQDALGDPSGARQTCVTAVPANHDHPDLFRIRVGLLTRLAASQAARGDKAEARLTLSQATDPMKETLEFAYEWKIVCLSLLAPVQYDMGDVDAAKKTLAEAQKQLEVSERKRWTNKLGSEPMIELAVALGHCGDRAAAQALIERARAKEPEYSGMLERVLAAQIRIGDWDGATRTANSPVLNKHGMNTVMTAEIVFYTASM